MFSTVGPTAQTPLKSYGLDLCLTPSSQSCSPNDNDRLIYKPGQCTESHFQFTLDADGVLRHSCSGKMVCPENGGDGNGAKIVVSSACKVEDSKFERTSGKIYLQCSAFPSWSTVNVFSKGAQKMHHSVFLRKWHPELIRSVHNIHHFFA